MIGIITQARMTSTRLPGKVLMEAGGQPLLQHHIFRLRQSDFPVYVATTTNPTDNPIADFCESRRIPFFRGSENDVLGRFDGAAEQFGLDTIVRVTSDCPLIDGAVIARAIREFSGQLGAWAYLSNTHERTYPRGFDFEVFSRAALKCMNQEATHEFEREHVTPFIWKSHPDEFTILHFKRHQDASGFRLTVDEPDDFELIKILIEKYRADQKDAEEIIRILSAHPELVAINWHVEQKKVVPGSAK